MIVFNTSTFEFISNILKLTPNESPAASILFKGASSQIMCSFIRSKKSVTWANIEKCDFESLDIINLLF